MTLKTTLDRALAFIANLKSIKRIWPYLRYSKKTIITSCLLIPVVSILQAVLPFIMQYVIDEGVQKKEFDIIYMGGALFITIVFIEYAVAITQSYLASKSFNYMTYKMRNALINHVMSLSPRFHDQNLSGSLVTRCTSDFDNLNESLSEGLLSSVVNIAVLIGAIIGLTLLSPTMAGYFLLVMPILMIIVYWFSKKLKIAIHRAREKVAILNGFAQECLFGLSTLKTLVAENFATTKFKNFSKTYRNAQMKSVLLDALMFSILEGLSSITIGLILWFLFFKDTPSQELTAGILIGSIQYIQKIFEPLKHLSNKIAILQGAFAALDRIFNLFEKNDKIPGTEVFNKKSMNIKFEKTSFRYGADEKIILKNIDIDIPPGSSLAIVGPTGSGKSTFIKILSKMYSGYTGSVKIGNQEIKNLDPILFRKYISIVPQDIILFNDTILFNITMNRDHISKEAAIKAARMVGIHDFIAGLHDQYDTEVLEDGKNLSYGQKQLLIFARAIVTNPEILILDEATSTIDTKTEAVIKKALKQISQKRTVIMIAHRLSTIKECDRIAYLSNGVIKELGSHDELIVKDGYYKSLYQGNEKLEDFTKEEIVENEH